MLTPLVESQSEVIASYEVVHGQMPTLRLTAIQIAFLPNIWGRSWLMFLASSMPR